jgi:hypothetical protein
MEAIEASFLSIQLFANWSGTTVPAGIPTQALFTPVDVIGPKSVRHSPGNMIDVCNYKSTKDAEKSTRTVNVTAVIPAYSVGVTWPK